VSVAPSIGFDGGSIVIWRAETAVGLHAAVHGSEKEQTLLEGLLAESHRILRYGRRQLGLERLERVASCLLGVVIGGNVSLFDNLEVFETGIFDETMDDNPGFSGIRPTRDGNPVFSGIRRRGMLELVGGSTEVELGSGGTGESGDCKCGELQCG
jgi:hypothetical protein